jgi:hypothetical protein
MSWAAVGVLTAGLLTGCATPPPVSPALTEAERDAFTAERNDARWQRFFSDRTDIQPPEIEVVAYVEPGGTLRRWASCINEAGYEQVREYGDGLTFNVDRSEVDAAYLAFYTCAAQYPVDPAQLGYLSQRQLGLLWDYYETRLLPCLALNGVPSSLDLTREQFIALGLADAPPNPYTSVVGVTGSEWRALDVQCPPPDPAVYGTLHP